MMLLKQRNLTLEVNEGKAAEQEMVDLSGTPKALNRGESEDYSADDFCEMLSPSIYMPFTGK